MKPKRKYDIRDFLVLIVVVPGIVVVQLRRLLFSEAIQEYTYPALFIAILAVLAIVAIINKRRFGVFLPGRPKPPDT
jgi:hypothetical protein